MQTFVKIAVISMEMQADSNLLILLQQQFAPGKNFQ